MVIKKIKIKNFGKVQEKEWELSPGMNVLYGENESGKTTMHMFLKSMFFGIQKLRGRASKKDVYTTYEPWDNPVTYGGTLWFENAGRNFRLSRNFHKTCAANEFFCEDDGEVLDVEQGDLDAILGISQAVYENTVSIGQLKSVTGPDLIKELQNYMASYQGTGDGSVDIGRAMQMLKMMRKGYQVQEEKRQSTIQKEQEKIQANMDYVFREKEELKEKQAQIVQREASLQIQGKNDGETLLNERIAKMEQKKISAYGLIFATVLVTFLVTVLLMNFMPDFSLKILLPIFMGTLAVCIESLHLKQIAREIQKRRNLKERWIQKQEKLQWSREQLEESRKEKETAYQNLETEYEEQEQQMYALSPAGEEVEALNLAMTTIQRLSGNIHNLVGERVRKRTSQILGEITGGKYTEVLMDEEFHMTVNTKERIVALESLSRGTIEQIYFALRMAAGELFCGEEVFPVILDDVFGMYDEERLTAILRWLSKEKRQVIISTCNKREMEILEKENISYQKILL